MRPFTYVRARDRDNALAAASGDGASYVAGGTTLIDLMRLDVMHPTALVDITTLPLGRVELRPEGLRIGALVTNSDLADHAEVRSKYPVLSEALLAGASPQLRHMATLGGNLLQRTRCAYFRDVASPCNKRSAGAGCSAQGGYTRMHAILGGGPACIATHPSDMCVALVALDAVVGLRAPDGTERAVPVASFHSLPGDNPMIETVLRDGELIIHVDLPSTPRSTHSHYVKVRDRASYAFALASAAVALDVSDGVIRDARVALGGVGTKPWRSAAAERVLVGAKPSDDVFTRAGVAATEGASTTLHNAFKVTLAARTVTRALRELGERA